jgi:predicted nucleic acid-binding protein
MSQRKVLLDTNQWINAFKDNDAKEKLIALIGDENVRVYMTPLIAYEILRGCKTSDELDQYTSAFESLVNLDVTTNVAELAAEIYREDKKQAAETENRNVDKRNFDVFHFACAKVFGLETMTSDRGFAKLEELYLNTSHHHTSSPSNLK